MRVCLHELQTSIISLPSFFIHFPKPELSRATVSSFNQFSKCKNTPSRTVGNEHCNNNNTKSNLNYALKRLGQNNPQYKHKRGGGGRHVWSNAERRTTCMCRFVFFFFSWWWDLWKIVFDFGCKNDEGVYFGKWASAGDSQRLLFLK